MHRELGKAHAGKKGDEEADKGKNVRKAAERKKRKHSVYQKKEYYKIDCGEHKHQNLFHGSSPEQSGTMAYRPVCKLCLVTIIPNTAPKSTGMREAEGEGPKRKFDKNRAASHTNVPRGTFTKRRPKKLFKKCALCYTKMAK